ncbi:hypothetical protein [Methylophaga sp.]|uniref:hypothetical protein n=1 Tax=Methylophaga sp. TaxID=2024840 RepID=UPI00272207E1|nr:hypothetical protein [Methylophaga sp.]MDO8826197.1 hypothetical protein [Methylophaga sp.]
MTDDYRMYGDIRPEKRPIVSNLGLKRLPYFLRLFVTGIIAGLLAGFVAPHLTELFVIIPLVYWGLLTYFTSFRLRNIGYKQWYAILVIIPMINIFVILPCLVLPEKYAQHRKLDSAGQKTLIACIIILGILVVAGG